MPLKEAGFTVGDSIKPAPKMLIYDVLSGLSNVELVGELYERNHEEVGMSREVKAYIRPRFKIGSKGKATEHRVVEMPGSAMKVIRSIGHVFIKYGSYMDTTSFSDSGTSRRKVRAG